ncbi:hypothetical protein ACGYLO_16435 [Sulfitobacter sp. 1A13353]|uniref:hypothetical protein n=1 Tax=Sulfitobacter sp. 1A13353 TaxID=3368568 RepID=UPI00374608F8
MNPYDRIAANPPPGVYDHQIGTEDGETCGRYPLPDEDAPRWWKPKPCKGEMTTEGGFVVCDTCGEVA